MVCFSFVFWGVLNITRGKPNDGVLLQLFFVMSNDVDERGDKFVKQSDRPLTTYEINILWWGRCKGMPILGVCWKFFLLEWTITYHLSLSSFFASFGDGRFWAHHQLLSWRCGCNKSCFGHPTSCFVWKSLEANIPPPSFFGTDTTVWILPTLKGMFFLKIQGQEGWRNAKNTNSF